MAAPAALLAAPLRSLAAATLTAYRLARPRTAAHLWAPAPRLHLHTASLSIAAHDSHDAAARPSASATEAEPDLESECIAPTDEQAERAACAAPPEQIASPVQRRLYAFRTVRLRALKSLSALLMHFTRPAAPLRDRLVSSCAELVGHDPSTVQDLYEILERHSVTPETFVAWRNAVCCDNWAAALEELSQVQAPCPVFVLARMVPHAHSPVQVSQAVALAQSLRDSTNSEAALRVLRILAERALLHLHSPHLAIPLTEAVLRHCDRFMETHPRTKSSTPQDHALYFKSVVDALLWLSSALTRFNDERCRDSASAVLHWAQQQERLPARTSSHVAHVLLDMPHVPRMLAARRVQPQLLAQDKLPRRSERFLTLPLAKEALDALDLAPRHHALALPLERAASAALRAGSMREAQDFAMQVKGLRQPRHASEQEQARHARRKLAVFSQTSLSSEAWETLERMLERGADPAWNPLASTEDDAVLPSGPSSDAPLADHRIWLSIVALSARDPQVQPWDLLQLLGLDPLREPKPGSIRPPASLLHEPGLYAVLVRNFELRPQPFFEDAEAVWNIMQERKVAVDAAALEAFCAAQLRARRVSGALRTLRRYTSRGAGRIQTSIHLFNIFLDATVRLGSGADVWRLVTGHARRARLSLGGRTLVLLMRAARKDAELGHAHDAQMSGTAHRSLSQSVDEPDSEKPGHWDGVPAPMRAWQLFRTLLLSQHPELASCESALEKADGGGWFWRREMQLRRAERWLWDRLSRLTAGPSADSSKEAPLDDSVALHQFSQRPIVFNDALFHEYVRLVQLLRTSDAVSGIPASRLPAQDEIFRVLSWMRALHVTPRRKTLRIVCLELAEHTPPAASGGRDTSSAAGPLHDWLASWLGEEAIPTEAEVGAYFKRHSDTRQHRR
jgi:hypothetical protein